MEITLSPEQILAVAAATGTTNNLLIFACAGGAKTTTMCAIARAFGPGRRIVALAFGTDAAESLSQKMPYYVESSTFHKFCYDALGAALGRKPRPDGIRCRWLLKKLVPEWKARVAVQDAVLTLVSRFKSTTADPTDTNALASVADRFDIEATPSILDLAQRVLSRCAEDRNPKTIDFDDMLWLPWLWNIPFPPVAVVLLDEAQDTNGVQRALLSRILAPKQIQRPVVLNDPQYNGVGIEIPIPRLIAVGDSHQSIYGFRGADGEAMSLLRSEFNMTELALSVSYRCSQAVVAEAQKYL